MHVVIGATGNTGSVVAKGLLAGGQKVRAILRTADRTASVTRLGAEPFVVDVADQAVLSLAFARAQAAYNMS